MRDIVDGRWQEPAGDADDEVGKGLWALPGLADAHAHLATRELNTEPGNLSEAIERAKRSLRAGVTLILDKGWRDDTAIRVLEVVDPGDRPEIEGAGTIIHTADGYYRGFGHVIDPEDVGQAVSEEAGAGAGWVKLIGDWPRSGLGAMPNFDADQLAEAVAAAETAGVRVAIHTMAPDVPSMAVAAGVHSIEHGLFLTESDLDALGGREGIWVPTLLRNEATLAQLGADSSGGRLFVEGLGRVRKLLPLAVEAGVHVLAGTDLIGSPADVAAEAIRLSEYGLAGAAVVAAVSTAAFEATGRDATFGPGSIADAVLFEQDPTETLGVLAHPTHVIRRGRVI